MYLKKQIRYFQVLKERINTIQIIKTQNNSIFLICNNTLDVNSNLIADLEAVEKTESSKTDYIYTDKAVAKMNKKVIHNDFSNEWVENTEDFQTYLKRLERNYLANIKD